MKKEHTNRHHIIPESRLNGKTVIVPIVSHQRYHLLFNNMTPPEIIAWLNENFWGNHYLVNIKEV